MDDSKRIFAPKPVKRNSNSKGLKINTDFERIKKNTFTTYTPNAKSVKKFISENLTTYDTFEKDLRDSSSTSEILSILYQSTGVDSLISEQPVDDDYLYVDECRTSMPPMRCKNPFYKNFRSVSDTDRELLCTINDDDVNYGDYFRDVEDDVNRNDPK
jgi:hypothetical protein